MLLNSSFKGHFLAIFTIGVWGITFSSTKILLADFAPSEILFIRFLIAFVFLSALCRHSIGFCGLKYEVIFIFAGLFGGCLYFLAENIALQYTSASNASLLVAINPFFTGLLFAIFYHKKMSRFFIFGFIFACVGIILVIFQGNFHIEIYPVGDFLCILAGLTWSIYTLFLEMIFKHFKAYSHIVILKKIFFYGLIWTLPVMCYENGIINGDFEAILHFSRYMDITNALNLLFLGVVASGLCYLTWNMSLKFLGSLKASVYIYAVPVVGVSAACILLGESISLYIIIGGILTLFGIFLSQK